MLFIPSERGLWSWVQLWVKQSSSPTDLVRGIGFEANVHSKMRNILILVEIHRKGDCRQTGKGSSKTPSSPPLHLKEVKTLLKQKQKSAWRLKNNGYDPQKDQINTLDRRTQITIFHLRTGHCGLRKHLKKIGSCWFSSLWMWRWGANS